MLYMQLTALIFWFTIVFVAGVSLAYIAQAVIG